MLAIPSLEGCLKQKRPHTYRLTTIITVNVEKLKFCTYESQQTQRRQA